MTLCSSFADCLRSCTVQTLTLSSWPGATGCGRAVTVKPVRGLSASRRAGRETFCLSPARGFSHHSLHTPRVQCRANPYEYRLSGANPPFFHQAHYQPFHPIHLSTPFPSLSTSTSPRPLARHPCSLGLLVGTATNISSFELHI